MLLGRNRHSWLCRCSESPRIAAEGPKQHPGHNADDPTAYGHIYLSTEINSVLLRTELKNNPRFKLSVTFFDVKDP